MDSHVTFVYLFCVISHCSIFQDHFFFRFVFFFVYSYPNFVVCLVCVSRKRLGIIEFSLMRPDRLRRRRRKKKTLFITKRKTNGILMRECVSVCEYR